MKKQQFGWRTRAYWVWHEFSYTYLFGPKIWERDWPNKRLRLTDCARAKLVLIPGTIKLFWTMWRMRTIVADSWTCPNCFDYHEAPYRLIMVTFDGGRMSYCNGDQTPANDPCPTCGKYSDIALSVGRNGIEL